MSNPSNQDEDFPWHIGIFDAHCHPTDTMSSIPKIPSLKTRALTIMSTRSQDQTLVSDVASKYGVKSSDPQKWTREECIVPSFGWHPWFSYQMYIDEDVDEGEITWNQNQNQNGKDTTFTPNTKEPRPLEGAWKIQHYKNVLNPSGPKHLETYNFLPSPQPFSLFLAQTRKHLQTHPYALIGEVGLDRQFRIPETWAPSPEQQQKDGEKDRDGDGELTPGGREGRRLTPFRVDMAHQKRILTAQLRLAAEMARAVSVHGVQAHGVVFEVLRELWRGCEREVLSKRERKKRDAEVRQNGNSVEEDEEEEQKETETEKGKPRPFPPRICLHSYSGNPDAFKQYLDPKIPVEMFVSFSTAINLGDNLDAKEGDAKYDGFVKMIRTVPKHMLLVESDLHTAGEAMDQRMEDIVRRVCAIRGWGLEEGARVLRRNWLRFVFGDGVVEG